MVKISYRITKWFSEATSWSYLYTMTVRCYFFAISNRKTPKNYHFILWDNWYIILDAVDSNDVWTLMLRHLLTLTSCAVMKEKSEIHNNYVLRLRTIWGKLWQHDSVHTSLRLHHYFNFQSGCGSNFSLWWFSLYLCALSNEEPE
jgi:hypothetical protein